MTQSTKPMGPFCQSCSMPMENPEDFGTNEDGSRNEEYCHYCFQKGKFTDPGINVNQMIEKLVSMAPRMNMPPDLARQMAQATIPNLKRWKK